MGDENPDLQYLTHVSPTKHWLDLSCGDCCSSLKLRHANVAFEVNSIGRGLPVLWYRIEEAIRTGYRRLTAAGGNFLPGDAFVSRMGLGVAFREAAAPRNLESDRTSVMSMAGDERVCASMLRFHGCVAFGACR
jgi:hypothetical protein